MLPGPLGLSTSTLSPGSTTARAQCAPLSLEIRPHAVIVSVAEWESLQETLELLADPRTRADLVEAAAAEERGDVTTEEEMAAIMAARLGRASA